MQYLTGDTTTVQTKGYARETGKLMHQMVDTYYEDAVPFAHLTITEFFDFVKSIPFKDDPPDREFLQRPAYTFNQIGPGGDCDDKAIALASYCKLHAIPYRFVAVRRSDMPYLHHVFCELFINGQWIHADPTYKFNSLGRERESYVERQII